MAFSTNVSHLPYFRDFERASEWERNVKPIRGKTIKPLGKRSAQHMQILRYGEGTDDERIACRLHETDCVTYYKDGRVHLQHGGYITDRTAKFIDRIIPTGGVCRRDGYLILSLGGGKYQIGDNGLWLSAARAPIDPEPFVHHVIKRDVAKQVRKLYAPFKQYALALSKLLDGVVDTEGRSMWGRRERFELTEEAQGDNPEHYGALVQQAMMSASEVMFDRGTNHWKRVSTQSAVERVIDQAILRLHRDEVFEVQTMPRGEYVKDKYKKFFQ